MVDVTLIKKRCLKLSATLIRKFCEWASLNINLNLNDLNKLETGSKIKINLKISLQLKNKFETLNKLENNLEIPKLETI